MEIMEVFSARRSLHDLTVRAVGDADVDGMDVLSREELIQVRRCRTDAFRGCEGGCALGGPRTDCTDLCASDLAPARRPSAREEAGADQSDASASNQMAPGH